MTPADVGHILQIVADDAVKAAVSLALNRGFGVISAVWLRRRAKAEATGDAERVEREVVRLEDAAAGMTAAFQDSMRSGKFDTDVARDEASEPGFEQFVEKAVDAAAASTSEAKRLLLGSMIARRLQVRTDSLEEVALRRAVDVVEYLNESQLLLLAALCLKNMLGQIPEFIERPSVSRYDLEDWLVRNWGSALLKLSVTSWTSYDLEVLAEFGLVRLPAPGPGALLLEEPRSGMPVQQWLAQNRVDALDFGPDIDPMNPEHSPLIGERFPTIRALANLIEGDEGLRESLEYAIVSPAGWNIGELVLDRLGTAASITSR